TKTTTTETEHRISFTNAIDLSQQRSLVIDLVEHVVHVSQRRRGFQLHLQLGQLVAELFRVRQKLVKRRIEETNGHWQSCHLAKDPDEITTLQRQQLLERFLTRADALRKNHLAHCCESLIAEEHVLRATEADSLGAKLPRRLRIQRRVRIRPHAQTAKAVGPRHELVEVSAECRLDRRHLAQKHAASRT